MKHSQTIGILLCLALIYATTQPFVIIESRNWVITGWNPVGSSFGQSGKFLCFFAALSALFFALPYIWAKRFNMVFGALMLAWAFRNFLILSTCQMGECPQRQWALYGCIILSGLILLMTFLPKIKVEIVVNDNEIDAIIDLIVFHAAHGCIFVRLRRHILPEIAFLDAD